MKRFDIIRALVTLAAVAAVGCVAQTDPTSDVGQDEQDLDRHGHFVSATGGSATGESGDPLEVNYQKQGNTQGPSPDPWTGEPGEGPSPDPWSGHPNAHRFAPDPNDGAGK
jgi:hypothetical protein